jgi:ABC-2 type transport system permease protein
MTSTAPTTSTIVSPTKPAAGATAPSRQARATTASRIPLTRIVAVELRKSFDTRSGFWLLAGIGLAAVLTTGAVTAWAPRSQFA